MYDKWLCTDGVISPIAGSVASAGSGDNYIEVCNNYFQEFDYEPPEDCHLLSRMHSQDTFSIYKEENVVFQVKLNDPLNTMQKVFMRYLVNGMSHQDLAILSEKLLIR